MIQATKYWNKVIKNPSKPFKTEVLKEYKIKSKWTFGGSLNDLKKRIKDHPRMTIHENKIIEDKGRYYGIHSYIIYQAINEVSSLSGS